MSRQFWSKLRAFRGRERRSVEMREELEAHLRMEADANRERGMTAEEALAAARRRFGNPTQLAEASHESWTFAAVESWLQDIRFGLRMLGRNRGFTAVAVLTLALGIGANIAIFSVTKAVLLAPLPYPQPDRIVRLETTWDQQPPQPYISIAKFASIRERTDAFQDATLYWAYGGRVNLTGGDHPEQLSGIHVSEAYFRLFGARVAVGRTFSAAEDQPSGGHVVVISNGLWHRRFGADPGLIGRNIGIGGAPYQVIGVLAPGFHWERDPDVWLPLQINLNDPGLSHEYFAAARLRSGISLAKADAALKVAFSVFHTRLPGPSAFPGKGFAAEPIDQVMGRDIRSPLRLLFGAALLVLLIACANLANLLLVRNAARSHELALRAAMAATRSRIIRQLLTESALLSMAGAVLGLALGYLGLHTLLNRVPISIPRIGERGAGLSLDGGLIAFAVAAAGLTVFVCGLVPVLQASRTEINEVLKRGGGRTATGRTRARSILIVAEVALAVVLLAGSALMVRTYVATRAVEPGFDGQNVVALDMTLDHPRFQHAAEIARLVADGSRRVEKIAGVEAAATTWSLPLEPPADPQFLTIVGRPLGNQPFHGSADWRLITPHYFEVFRIGLVRGRPLSPRDTAASAPVLLINSALAQAFWKNADPIGQRIWINKGLGKGFEEPAPREIVGIVGDVKDGGLSAATRPIMYVPVAQVQDNVLPFYSQAMQLMWVVRAKSPPLPLAGEIQKELRVASGGVPIGHVRSMEEVRRGSTAYSDFAASLFMIFGGLALVMATIGLYGVIAFSVEQRRREIGIRIAIGASPYGVLGMILRESARLAITGIAIGVACALALTRLMASLLFGVKPRDPLAFATVVLVLGAVTLLASCVPARRGMQTDPASVLRHE